MFLYEQGSGGGYNAPGRSQEFQGQLTTSSKTDDACTKLFPAHNLVLLGLLRLTINGTGIKQDVVNSTAGVSGPSSAGPVRGSLPRTGRDGSRCGRRCTRPAAPGAPLVTATPSRTWPRTRSGSLFVIRRIDHSNIVRPPCEQDAPADRRWVMSGALVGPSVELPNTNGAQKYRVYQQPPPSLCQEKMQNTTAVATSPTCVSCSMRLPPVLTLGKMPAGIHQIRASCPGPLLGLRSMSRDQISPD